MYRVINVSITDYYRPKWSRQTEKVYIVERTLTRSSSENLLL